MHHRCRARIIRVRLYAMARRRRRKTEKARRHAPPAPKRSTSPPMPVRRSAQVERLAYTRRQAAEALGVSRSTFDRRVLPLLETLDMPWGPQLVPVDELERFVKEQRRPARGRAPTAPAGRPTAVPSQLVRHIQAARANGRSLRQIARDLNANNTPTAHGGAQWWPSTVRAVLRRAQAPTTAPKKTIRTQSAPRSFRPHENGGEPAKVAAMGGSAGAYARPARPRATSSIHSRSSQGGSAEMMVDGAAVAAVGPPAWATS